MHDTPPPRAFGALRLGGYRAYLITFTLTMMADNIEHVISYWVAFQKFHSAALGGFAVVSHWVPFLLFSVPVGALNDRFDSRRIIQTGGVLFMIASCAWGYLFLTDSLQMWHAMLLLTIHGCAACLWYTSSQVLLYDIVGPQMLPSAVRLAASARYLGVLVGPGVGSLVMLTLGPTRGIFANALFYVPLFVWLIAAPYGRNVGRTAEGEPKRPIRGLADIVQTVRDIRHLPVITSMVILAGAVSFFIGNSYQAQMPGFAEHLGHGDPGAAYTALLGADAAGALLGGILLESRGGMFTPRPQSAFVAALVWAITLGGFALTNSYPLALLLLCCAGFSELLFSSMSQTLVQLHAPDAVRGRALGLYGMASGLRAFSGVTVGLAGSLFTIHASLAISAASFFVVVTTLLLVMRARTARTPAPG
jgi:MFS family permease